MTTSAVHDVGCPLFGRQLHSYAALKCSDAVNVHVSAQGWDAVKKWVAVRLSDGTSDGTLYDTRRDAIRHQLHEKQCAYICVPPGGINPCQAESYLRMTRNAYDAGMYLADPETPEIIRRLTRRDQARQERSIRLLKR